MIEKFLLNSKFISDIVQLTPPPPAPAPHRNTSLGIEAPPPDIQAALKDIRTTLQRTKTLPPQPPQVAEKVQETHLKSPQTTSPIWVPRQIDNVGSLESIEKSMKNVSGDEDEADTDLETDRLLGHQRLDDMGFYDDKNWCDRKPRSLMPPSMSKVSPTMPSQSKSNGNSMLRQGLNSLLPTTPEIAIPSMKNSTTLVDIVGNRGPLSSPEHEDNSSVAQNNVQHSSPPNMTDSPCGSNSSNMAGDKKKTKSKEGKNLSCIFVLFCLYYYLKGILIYPVN